MSDPIDPAASYPERRDSDPMPDSSAQRQPARDPRRSHRLTRAELAALVARVADGDELAFERLYDATAPAVHGLTTRILGDADAAEETSHDAFLQVHRRAETFDPDRAAATTWILTIARTRALDRLRRVARGIPLRSIDDASVEFEGPDATSDGTELGERRRLVRGALARLNDDEREVLGHAFFRGLSHSEIAERLEQPLGTIKSRIRSGLAKLRRFLGALDTDEPA